MVIMVTMQTVTVTELKARFSEIAEEVSRSGQAVLVTKRGQPIMRLLPPGNERKRNQLGHLADTVLHMGDIVSPAFDVANDPLSQA